MNRPVALGVLLALLGASVATPCRADGKPPLAQSLPGEARKSYELGRTLFQKGDFESALAQFRGAYAAAPDPRLLFNIALAEKNLKRYDAALTDVAAYLAEGGASGEAERREAEDFAQAMQAFVAIVVVKTTPAAAHVLVDGKERGVAPVSLRLDMGEHVFEARAEGYQVAQVTRRADGATKPTVELALAPLTASVVVRVPKGASIRIDGSAVGEGEWTGPLAVGTHTIAASASGKKPRETRLMLRPGETRRIEWELEDAHRAAAWPWVIGGVALAAVASSVVGGYFLLRPRDTVYYAPGTVGSYRLP